MKEPKYRRPLNNYQKDILLALYKFRFASIELLFKYQGLKSAVYTYKRVQRLVDQKYIGQLRSEGDVINRKPATLFLLPRGVQVLKSMPELSQKMFSAYNNRRLSPAFRDRCLTIFRLYNRLIEIYGDHLTFYSKTEMSTHDVFPKPLPDGFITIASKPFLMEWLPATTAYPAIRGRLSQLITHYESSTWEQSGIKNPTVLFICEGTYIERQVQRIARRSILNSEDIDFDNMPMLTTTLNAFRGASSTRVPIWSNIEDPEEPVTLT